MTKQASTSCSKEAGRCAQSGLASRFALLAFEAGFEDYCEREVDEVEWQGGRVYLHPGVRRDDPPRARWWPRAQGSRSGRLTLAGDQAEAAARETSDGSSLSSLPC